jgi:hypothetical protein
MRFRKCQEALFKGMRPRFPKGINQLNQLYSSGKGFSVNDLREVLRGVPGFYTACLGLLTSDGYHWHVQVIFLYENEVVYVLFPWRDNKGMERSVALYPEEAIPKEALVRLVGKITKSLEMRQVQRADVPA